MASSIVRTFTDPDGYHAAIRDAQTEGIITGRGSFRAEWTSIRLDRLSIQRSEEGLARVSYSQLDPGAAVVVFPTFTGPPVYIHGLETLRGDIVVYRAGSMGYDRSTAACRWGALALTHEDLDAAGEAIIGRELNAPLVTHRIRPSSPLVSRLLNLHRVAGHLAKTAPEYLANPEVGRGLEQALVEAMVSCLADRDTAPIHKIPRRQEMVMRRLEEVLQANSDRSLYIADVCAAVGVSYPTLRAFCHERLGMSPKQYLLRRRMHLARRALRTTDPEKTTVTEIATGYGFWELGRFSVAYRALFGETPVSTLRRPPEDPRPRESAGSPWQFIKSA